MPEISLNIANVKIRLRSRLPPRKETTGRFRFDHFILKNIPPSVDIDLDLEVIPKYKQYRYKELFRVARNASQDEHSNDGKKSKESGSHPGKRGGRCLGRSSDRCAGVSEKKIPREDDSSEQYPDIPLSEWIGLQKLSKREKRYLGRGLDWRIGRSGKKLLIEGAVTGRYQLLINEDLDKGKVFIINKNNKWNIADVIYGFLQVLTIYYLAKKRLGVLFHSAGLRDNKRGFLFAGVSGAGKSTTARIWNGPPDVSILNDDRIIIRKEGGNFYMYPTPWHGDYSEYFKKEKVKKTKLSKLFYIYHRDTNLAEKMGLVEGFDHFFKTLFLSFWDKDCVNFTFDFLVDIMSQKPCYKFGFKNDLRIIDYIRNFA